MSSRDGRWWWDGSRWWPAISADGRWRWDGLRWVRARRRWALPLSLLGAFSLMLLVPYALLTWIAVAGSPQTINSVADQARDTHSRGTAARLFEFVAPTLLICGLGLLVTGIALFATPLRALRPEEHPPPPPLAQS